MSINSYNYYLRKTINEVWAYAHSVFSPEECKKIIQLVIDSKKYSLELGEVGDEGKTDTLKDRNSRVLFLPSNDDDFLWVFERAASVVDSLNNQFFNFNVDVIESLQFSEYDGKEKGFYAKHRDEFYFSGAHRKLSFSIQLSAIEDYVGGELLLHHKDPPDIGIKDQGSITIFPSYVLHEVTPVTEGIRYSLVGWVLGQKFV